MAYKGLFRPKNPSKYAGDSKNIVYRSLWELKFMNFLDGHPDVILWASEEMCIPYLSPKDNRVHRYFPDFLIKTIDTDGNQQTTLIEIKPKNQTKPPKIKSKSADRKMINEMLQYAVNQAKWQAAEKFCEQRQWKFQVLTEDQLGIKY